MAGIDRKRRSAYDSMISGAVEMLAVQICVMKSNVDKRRRLAGDREN
ncbi:MAG TPA: hypothetical protein VMZ26_18530 [Pyrinomonadaceae bacterium]|nr:hypothetical protein [Pyrinomonadaceae bacterium]